MKTLCINLLLRPLAPPPLLLVRFPVRLQLVGLLAQLPVPHLQVNLLPLGLPAQVLVHPQNPPLLVGRLTHFQPPLHRAVHRTTMAPKLAPLKSTRPSAANPLASLPCPRVLATFLLPPLLQHSGNKQNPVKSVPSTLERLMGAGYSSCIILYREDSTSHFTIPFLYFTFFMSGK